MGKSKPWILRPVAWAFTILAMIGMQYLADLARRLVAHLLVWLGGLSTIAIVGFVLVFGGAVCGILYYSAFMIPVLVVSLSDAIYPSNHAFRYYFVGIYEIIGCALLIVAGIAGLIRGGLMILFYAQYGWLILASVIMIVTGHQNAKERHAN